MRESEYSANRALAERLDRIDQRVTVARAHRASGQVSVLVRAGWMLGVFISAAAIIGSYL